jgi:hypothetical protein
MKTCWCAGKAVFPAEALGGSGRITNLLHESPVVVLRIRDRIPVFQLGFGSSSAAALFSGTGV